MCYIIQNPFFYQKFEQGILLGNIYLTNEGHLFIGA